jgi:hypothetical protein
MNFHSDRAMVELDRAMQATCVEAARAHFGLSALHFNRLKSLRRKHPSGKPWRA